MANNCLEGGVRGEKRVPTRPVFFFSYSLLFDKAPVEVKWGRQALEPVHLEVLFAMVMRPSLGKTCKL
jgi:hypothetical protein